MTEQEYLTAASNLIGKSICKVKYQELDYEVAIPFYSRVDGLHCIDYGIIFTFMDGSVSSITWGGEFIQYGISFSATGDQGKCWEVTELDPWRDVFGVPISRVLVYWCPSPYGPGDGPDYPQDMELHFANGNVVLLCVSEISDDGLRLNEFSDNISVLFQTSDFARFKCGAFRLEARATEAFFNDTSSVALHPSSRPSGCLTTDD